LNFKGKREAGGAGQSFPIERHQEDTKEGKRRGAGPKSRLSRTAPRLEKEKSGRSHPDTPYTENLESPRTSIWYTAGGRFYAETGRSGSV